MSKLTESTFNKGIERGVPQGISQGATQRVRPAALAMPERHLAANLVSECKWLTQDDVSHFQKEA